MTTLRVYCSKLLCAFHPEPVGRSSDPKLETILEFDTTHLGQAAAEGAAVVHRREAVRKLGISYRQPPYAFVLSPRVTCHTSCSCL